MSAQVKRMMATGMALALLTAAACAVGAGAAGPRPGDPAPELSRKLSAWVYIEQGTDLILTVGARAAAFHEEDAFFPLEVSVTNRQKNSTWVITRESFTLIDAEGRRYELPSQQELAQGYTKRTYDNNLFDARQVTAGKHEGYRQVESNFFPDPVGGIRRRPDTVAGLAGVAPRSGSLIPIERVELNSMSFMEDVLYFPHPQGKLVGQRFSLELRAQGLEEPARIAFQIPRI